MTVMDAQVDTQTAGESPFDPEAVQEFKGRLRGALISPNDPEYDSARKIYNGMIDKRPALIARCVRYGRRHRGDQLRAGAPAGDRGARRRAQRARSRARG